MDEFSNGHDIYDMDKLTIPNAQGFKLHDPQHNNIIFYNTLGGSQVEVLRISKEGITANPNVPVDEAADAVIRALGGSIKNLSDRDKILEEVATAFDKMKVLGDTAASFAAYVRGMKR